MRRHSITSATLVGVIVELLITFDAGGVWGNGHAYRIDDRHSSRTALPRYGAVR
ncbi:MAG: hypothetical protein L0H41_08480 [Microlunatus sp.]|nr:hypothetical protein [Microlunatus sp.]MDN5771397.1 hypothetical protein [Microlunatus sp.]MDN5803207.1 hypothetical protein [Microlunatus sp.]